MPRPGGESVYQPDGDGNLTQVSLPEGSVFHYTYEERISVDGPRTDVSGARRQGPADAVSGGTRLLQVRTVMTVRVFLAVATALLCGRSLGSADEPVQIPLALKLDPAKRVFRIGESVEVVVTLYATDEEAWWVMIPGFDTGNFPQFPYLHLSFEVSDKRGQRVPELPTRSVDAVAEPDKCEFREYDGREFIGERVSLTDGSWAHRFPGPGRYRVVAVVRSVAREWLEHGIQQRILEEEKLGFDIEHVFQGTLHSREIEIEIAAAR